jgi:ATPase subunit of ABC transporter with duplicated ATPase domains
MDRLTDAQQALDHAEKLVESRDTSDEALKLLEEASIEFEAAGGFTVEQKISNVLKGLGFLMEEYDKRCDEFSGGWQMRIALARLLLSEPDILILDEPTNHLDSNFVVQQQGRNIFTNKQTIFQSTISNKEE